MSALAERVTETFSNFRIVERSETPKDYTSPEYVESLFKDTPDAHFLYKETGFETAKQASVYLKIKQENPDLSNLEINHIFAERTALDIMGYYWEFLARNPYLVNFADFDGESIISSKTGQRFLDVTNSDERAGAAKKVLGFLEDSIKERFEQDQIKPGIYAVHSPHGWAQEGYDEYPDDQIYLYQFDEHMNFSAGTIRLTMDLVDHEGFIREVLGQRDYNSNLNYKNRLIHISSTVIQLDGERIEDYVDRLENYLQTDEAWIDIDKKGRHIKTHTFDDLRDAIQNADKLIELDEDIESIAQKLDWYLRANVDYSNPENLRELVKQLGKSAMDMQDLVERRRGRKGKKDYKQLATSAKDYGGCVASASNEIRTRINAYGEKEYYVKKCGQCGVEIEGFIPKGYICKSCKGKFKGC